MPLPDQDQRNYDQLLLNQKQQLENNNLEHKLRNVDLQMSLLADQVQKLQAEIEKYKRDRESLLIWGILGLGAALLALAGWALKVVTFGGAK